MGNRIAVTLAVGGVALVLAACGPTKVTDPQQQRTLVAAAAQTTLQEQGYSNFQIARVIRDDALNWRVQAATGIGTRCLQLRFDDLTFEKWAARACP